ncbi:MAG TPA: lipoyl synthase [Gammaproteobacteria bacterium]|nr:lipoyl synthase [Gammaproteobacteria bacterium]
MSEFRGIPVVVTGAKYQTEQGFAAIKNGVKARPDRQRAHASPKPAWLKARLPAGERFERLRSTVREHRLATVCEESICPNIGECWNNGTATIMLMGKVCTRACQFCAVDTGNPHGWLDPDEVENSARSVELMNLDYVVLTSVDRDDLPDGGARHYADCIRAIKARCPQTAVEALTPDFAGNLADVSTVLDSGVDVFAQNLETVERLTHRVRDARAGYAQTLAVLAHAKRYRPDVLTKSSLMLGLGETGEEIVAALDDLRAADVDIVTFGQYLRPTVNHLPVEHFVTPEEFERYRGLGLARGFLEVVAGPLVRSSYRADRVFEKNNVGL